MIDPDQLDRLSPREAIALQRELATKVRLQKLKEIPRYVAGADISYRRGDTRLFAAVVVWDREEHGVVAAAAIHRPVGFPYVPGLLSFRETPPVLAAWQQLQTNLPAGVRPGMLLCDGQGYAHPRRFGLACHLGLLLDLPAAGCAKTRLIGEHDEPGEKRGERAVLMHGDDMLGYVLRTKDRVKPLYVSPGHRCDFDDAVAATLACDNGYRLPEPTRQAHLYVNRERQQNS